MDVDDHPSVGGVDSWRYILAQNKKPNPGSQSVANHCGHPFPYRYTLYVDCYLWRRQMELRADDLVSDFGIIFNLNLLTGFSTFHPFWIKY